jgi:hypothetical protein
MSDTNSDFEPYFKFEFIDDGSSEEESDSDSSFGNDDDECHRQLYSNSADDIAHIWFKSPKIIHSLYIDDNGIIFTGMPYDPEHKTSIDDLPIFKIHNDLELYRKFPVTKLEEQLYLSSTLREQVQVEFECFICQQKHIVSKEPSVTDEFATNA